MIKKKSGFLAFIFSLLPGAGQMYIGFMRRGLSLMSSFFLLILVAAWLNLDLLLLIMPMIWFYSFFDVHNLRALSDDEFHAMKDDFIFIPDISKDKARFVEKYRTVFAIVLLIIGFTLLWNNFVRLFSRFLPSQFMNFIYAFGRYIPQLIVGFLIIGLGIYLIRGKKKELDLIEDKGAL